MHDDLQMMAIEACIKDMFDSGRISICDIDKICHLLGREPEPYAYKILSPLHCVKFSKMRQELVDKLPELVLRAIGGGISKPGIGTLSQRSPQVPMIHDDRPTPPQVSQLFLQGM